MEDEIDFFCEDFDGVDFAALEKRFGKPEDVAKEFLSELGESALTRSGNAIFRLKHMAFAIVIAAAFVVVGLKIIISYKQQQVLDGFYIESITYENELTSDITGPTYAARTGKTEDIIDISE